MTTEEESEVQKVRKQSFDATHPGFTLYCDQCGSDMVYAETDISWDSEDGVWGSGVSLCCSVCGASSTLWEPS